MLRHGGHNDLKQLHIISGTQEGMAKALIKLLQMSAFPPPLPPGTHTGPPTTKAPVLSLGFVNIL